MMAAPHASQSQGGQACSMSKGKVWLQSTQQQRTESCSALDLRFQAASQALAADACLAYCLTWVSRSLSLRAQVKYTSTPIAKFASPLAASCRHGVAPLIQSEQYCIDWTALSSCMLASHHELRHIVLPHRA